MAQQTPGHKVGSMNKAITHAVLVKNSARIRTEDGSVECRQLFLISGKLYAGPKDFKKDPELPFGLPESFGFADLMRINDSKEALVEVKVEAGHRHRLAYAELEDDDDHEFFKSQYAEFDTPESPDVHEAYKLDSEFVMGVSEQVKVYLSEHGRFVVFRVIGNSPKPMAVFKTMPQAIDRALEINQEPLINPGYAAFLRERIEEHKAQEMQCVSVNEYEGAMEHSIYAKAYREILTESGL